MGKCDICDKPLLPEDWPWLYRSIGKVCLMCKERARILLKIPECDVLDSIK